MINFDDNMVIGDKNVERTSDWHAAPSEDKRSMSYSAMAFLVLILHL